MDKQERKQIQEDILEVIKNRNMSFQDLIQYVLNEAPEKYRVVLLEDSDMFQKAIKKQGTWTDTQGITDSRDQRHAGDVLNDLIRTLHIATYEDFIQYVLYEMPPDYITFIFEHSGVVLNIYKKCEKEQKKADTATLKI